MIYRAAPAYEIQHLEWCYCVIERPSRKTVATYTYRDEDSQARAYKLAKNHLEELDAFAGDRSEGR